MTPRTGRGVLGASLLFVLTSILLFQLGPASKIPPLSGGKDLLDMTAGYSPEYVRSLLSAYGPHGRTLYLVHLVLDCFYAALYGWSLHALIAYGFRRAPAMLRPLARLAMISFVGATLDLAENAGLFIVTASFPKALPNLVSIMSRVTSAKLILVQASFSLALLALIGGAIGMLAELPARRERTPV